MAKKENQNTDLVDLISKKIFENKGGTTKSAVYILKK